MQKRIRSGWLVLGAATVFCLAVFAAMGRHRGANNSPVDAEVHVVSIAANRPVSVTIPFEVVPIGPNGERGLWIGPALGAEQTERAEGTASYRVHVPADGSYMVWGYCRWMGGGFDSIGIAIDDTDAITIGGDGVFKKWHWVRAGPVRLKEGEHTIKLISRCENVGVRRLLLTNSPQLQPAEYGVAVSDIFYDDFDGCADGNFDLWRQCSGRWKVKHLDSQEHPAKRTLIGVSHDESLLRLSENWRNYVLNVSCRLVSARGDNSMTGICFGMRTLEYWRLQWREIPGKNIAVMELIRRRSGQAVLLERFEVPWAPGIWHDVQIGLAPGGVEIRVDNGEEKVIAVEGEIVGGIGLWLSGDTEAHFDDVQVRLHRSLVRTLKARSRSGE